MGQALDYTNAGPNTPPSAFETGFDIGDTVQYLGRDAMIKQVIVGPTAADPIRLTLSGEGFDATVDAAHVTSAKTTAKVKKRSR